MVIGDSVMSSAEPGMADALNATGAGTVVFNDATLGWGLVNHSPTRPLDYDWRSQWPALIARYHPDLVVGFWSWDDDVARDDPNGYSQVLDQAISVLLTPGNGVAGVILYQMPALDPTASYLAFYRSTGWTSDTTAAAVEQARESWNTVVAGAARQHPGQVLFSTASSGIDPGGVFATFLPSFAPPGARARAVDGVHVCPAGAIGFGESLVKQLEAMFKLPAPAAGWQDEVSRDPSYDLEPALCPPS
jgi:Rod binding domain-containing protein